MIQMPKRSVTRFFIPLIDVLILLFCIFLLMPLFKAQAGPGAEPTPDHPAQPPGDGSDTVEQLRAEVERLRKEKGQPLQDRLAVRVLQIDPANGTLVYYAPQRVEVRSEADAHDLIVRDRKAVGEGGRELYYEILFPREPDSAYPLANQRKLYDEWFKDVPHGWDVPGAPLRGAKR